MLEAIGGILTMKAGLFLGGLILTPIALFLGSKVKAYIKNKKKALILAINKIKDPDIQKLVKDIIASVETVMSSASGKAKFKAVKKQILDNVPDIFDPLVGAMIQATFDAMVESGEINKAN